MLCLCTIPVGTSCLHKLERFLPYSNIYVFLNVFVFPPVTSPQNWASKGIYGEKLWLSKRSEIPKHYAVTQQRLIVLGLIGMILIAGGLYQLHFWISILGAVILILAQLWRIDRFSTLYELYEEKDYQP